MVLLAGGVAVPAGSALAASGKPVVSGVSPASGTSAGGTTVTIKGQRFSRVHKVLFGSAAGTSLHVASATKLTVRAPQHGVGTVNIRVVTTAGESTITSKDHYTFELIWTAKEAPVPAHAQSANVTLNAVACGSVGSCVSVGRYVDATNRDLGLIEQLTASHWEAITAPLPAKANSSPGVTLNAVACPSASACVAVGTYLDSGNHLDSVIDTFAHGTWTAKQAPLPSGVAAGSSAQLAAVACHSAGSCAAVGTYTDSNGTNVLLEALASGHWSAANAHLPADATTTQNDQMLAVACPATNACTAVGSYDNPNQVGLVETLANGQWHPDRADLPGNADSSFQSVILPSISCKSASNCLAVGQYIDSAQRNEGLIETLPVGISSGSTAAVPSDGNSTPDVGLAAISCVSSAGCSDVGSYRDNTGLPAGLIEPSGGGPTRAPLPGSGGSDTALQSIDCAAAASCTTVGFYFDAHEHSQGLIDTLSGNRWNAKIAPVPANAIASPAYPYLIQVSCPSATSCVGIGQYQDSHNGVDGLLEAE